MGFSLFLNHTEHQEGHMLITGGGKQTRIKGNPTIQVSMDHIFASAFQMSRNPISPGYSNSDLTWFSIKFYKIYDLKCSFFFPSWLFVFLQYFLFFILFSIFIFPPFLLFFFPSFPPLSSFFLFSFLDYRGWVNQIFQVITHDLDWSLNILPYLFSILICHFYSIGIIFQCFMYILYLCKLLQNKCCYFCACVRAYSPQSSICFIFFMPFWPFMTHPFYYLCPSSLLLLIAAQYFCRMPSHSLFIHFPHTNI